MSEQQIGRSPVAMVAELASAIAIAFYLFCYCFFVGLMGTIDYQYISMFSAKDVIGFLPVTFLETTFRVSIAYSISSLMVRYLPRAISWIFALLVICWIISFVLLMYEVSSSLDPKSRDVLKALNMDNSESLESISSVSMSLALLMGGITFWRSGRQPKTSLRLVSYWYASFGIASSAYADGHLQGSKTHAAKPPYCVRGDGERFVAKIIISGDQNILFETETGELRVIPYSAIKSISNKSCNAPAEVKAK